MKKSLFILLMLFVVGASANAQKFALIDMEYILGNIPAYERANEQLEQVSKQWQGEIEKIAEEAKAMYKNYQSQIASLSEVQRGKKEEEIVAKEKSAADLRRKYFGPEGELNKKRESLLQPIQDKIYNAVKEIATQRGYAVVLDRASASSIIFASPNIDISNEVLAKLGYSN
ncbi:OmpH family outer membrane protein [Bacteroides heparinolyticus]|uniref:OmpH family outer membrane protein n=1 Tax=Prevotella heparinolytica TaxID=28113 RepID=A0A3P2AC33_9BACE|nr:OmpH family outer membrane protein [Bacteroides heparinolyticus]MCF0255493.1 OmpH family outer membrane protein [Bacteroides heparinolyticus]MCI6213345.1 OmpH family outer membrane protein [Bacteroides heparinolyticus]RRD93092.1 OmpH family outer membrane protein [Bacteroides heparinolyticus]VFB13186.1 outer membrane chaperone Skp [Bacteroides heparinolyticus]